jgi:hypothetical protein
MQTANRAMAMDFLEYLCLTCRMEVIMNDPLLVYLLKAFEELALANCGVRADSQELLHSEAKGALPVNKRSWWGMTARRQHHTTLHYSNPDYSAAMLLCK